MKESKHMPDWAWDWLVDSDYYYEVREKQIIASESTYDMKVVNCIRSQLIAERMDLKFKEN